MQSTYKQKKKQITKKGDKTQRDKIQMEQNTN